MSLNSRDRAIVTTRLARIRQGNLGDCKGVQGASDLYEIRINFGPGYRIYYGIKEKQILLLVAGIKEVREEIYKKQKITGVIT